jgi:Sec-independent protein translocase protein TatA
MLEVGWSEMLVIAIVMIVVVGPKDLPQACCARFGQFYEQAAKHGQ